MAQKTIRFSSQPDTKLVLIDRIHGVHADLYVANEKVRGAYFITSEGETHEYYIFNYFGLKHPDQN